MVLRGHLTMVGGLAGDQWNEGDVSCSVVRRVALPDAFLATDGLFETFLTVLDNFAAFPAMIERELARELPFLATSRMLLALVDAGLGREQAHEVVREHALAAARARREVADGDGAGPGLGDDLIAALAGDGRVPFSEETLREAVAQPLEHVGAARRQVAEFVKQVEAVVARHPEAAGYVPAEII
jgi:adenylosuccinate lyase